MNDGKDTLDNIIHYRTKPLIEMMLTVMNYSAGIGDSDKVFKNFIDHGFKSDFAQRFYDAMMRARNSIDKEIEKDFTEKDHRLSGAISNAIMFLSVYWDSERYWSPIMWNIITDELMLADLLCKQSEPERPKFKTTRDKYGNIIHREAIPDSNDNNDNSNTSNPDISK